MTRRIKLPFLNVLKTLPTLHWSARWIWRATCPVWKGHYAERKTLHTWGDLIPKYTFVPCRWPFLHVCEGACNYPLEHRELCLLKTLVEQVPVFIAMFACASWERVDVFLFSLHILTLPPEHLVIYLYNWLVGFCLDLIFRIWSPRPVRGQYDNPAPPQLFFTQVCVNTHR